MFCGSQSHVFSCKHETHNLLNLVSFYIYIIELIAPAQKSNIVKCYCIFLLSLSNFLLSLVKSNYLYGYTYFFAHLYCLIPLINIEYIQTTVYFDYWN
jgi:hypothetical protein